MNTLPPDMTLYEKLGRFWAWIRQGHYKIKDRQGQLIPLQANNMQRKLYKRILRMARQGRPVRLIILKARKEGCSTFIQALFAYLTQFTPYWSSRTIAHTEDSTADIHDITRRIFVNLERGPRPESTSNPVRFPHDSSLTTRTAGGIYVLSSATVNALHLSELPKWQGNVRDQLASVLGSVPQVPNSIVIIESTANMEDSSGQFKDRWQAAKGKLNPYDWFFSAWHDEESYQVAGAMIDDLTEYELWLQRDLKLTDPQIQWYRNKLHGDFNGDHVYMKQEFPSTEEEAFQSARGLVFPVLRQDIHDRAIPVRDLVTDNYAIYRAIDFGGADPFVCLWIAHLPGPSRFTVDATMCPETWRELTGYAWGPTGRPKDINDHTVDAARYACMHFDLTGHVHVFAELYEPDSAAHGRSILDQALSIRLRSQHLAITGTVCDRSQPGSIMLLSQKGVPAEANRVPERVSERGEKRDGIEHMLALMIASIPILNPREPEPRAVVVSRQLANMPVPVGVDSSEMMVALHDHAQAEQGRYHPIFGVH